jgi:hypothetical protein
VNEDRQAVLEAIAFGRDRTIRPAERLRAIELLAEIAGDADLDLELYRRVANLDGDELQAEQDAIVAGVIAAVDDAGLSARWPRTCEVITRRIEARARELAEELPTRVLVVHEGGGQG